MKKIDAAKIFEEEFQYYFNVDEAIRMWNAYAYEHDFDNTIYYMNSVEIMTRFGEMSAWDALCELKDLDSDDDFFIDGVYRESFTEDDIWDKIYLSELFRNRNTWCNEDGFLEDYCQEIANECDIDVDGEDYGIDEFKDFIEEYYSYNNVPSGVSKIKQDWKQYLEDNDF